MKKGGLLFLGLLFLFSFCFVHADSVTGSTATYFSTSYYVCVNDQANAYWQTYDPINPVPIIPIYNVADTTLQKTVGLCNLSGSSDRWCCPSGFICDHGLCTFNVDAPLTSCSNIQDEVACNSSDPAIAVNILSLFAEGNFDYTSMCNNASGVQWFNGNNVLCGNFTNCGCSWNSGKCKENVDVTTQCADGYSTNTSCNWLENPDREDNCNDPSKNNIIIFYTSTWGGVEGNKPDWCMDQRQIFPCTVSVKLPFFGIYQFIGCVLAISMIYLFIRRR